MPLTEIRGNTQIKAGTITDTQVAAAAGIATSKLADGANFLKKDGSVALTGSLNAGGNTFINLAAPATGTDAATKSYVDTLLNGRDWKPSVRVASTANVNTASAPAVIDGINLAGFNRVLLKNQTTPAENGIWVWNGNGVAMTRAADAAAGNLSSQATVFVEEGTHSGQEWNLSTPDPITVGTTPLTWVQSGSVTAYTGTNGVQVVGTVISPVYGTTAGTVCQGNDARLSDARTPVGTTLNAGQLFVGSGSNLVAAVTPGGDVQSVSIAGAFMLAAAIRRTSSFLTRETPTGAVNGSNTVFGLAAAPVGGTDHVYLNGILQDAGAGNDYTISGSTITFASAPLSGDKIRVSYQV